MSLIDAVPLEPEQQELLVILVEAARSVPSAARESFFLAENMTATDLHHPGLAGGLLQGVHIPDVRVLWHGGLLDHRSIGSSSWELDVLPRGFRYYEELKQRSGGAAQHVEESIRLYLRSERFKATYPGAYAKWAEAESLLWGSDSDRASTTIGHLCREAMQSLATAFADRFQVQGTNQNAAKTVDRIRAVLTLEQDRLGSTHKAFLDALLAYWGTVSDLVQRQEHGAQRERRPLLWKDARRVVFQTAIVMFEIADALD